MKIIINFDNKTVKQDGEKAIFFDEYWSPVQQPTTEEELWSGFIDDLNYDDTQVEISIVIIENGTQKTYHNTGEEFQPAKKVGRSKGAKNNKPAMEKRIATSVSEDIYNWCNRFNNASKYLRTLIELDYEKKEK